MLKKKDVREGEEISFCIFISFPADATKLTGSSQSGVVSKHANGFVSVSRQHEAAGCWEAKKQSGAYHSWKFAACVESQKSMPSTAVAVSPAGSSSVDTQRQQNKEEE